MATGVLERTQRLLPPHGRKMIEELIERVTSRDVIHQGLKRYARADKNRLPPENIGITVYRSRGCRHGSLPLHNRNIRACSFAWPTRTPAVSPPLRLSAPVFARRGWDPCANHRAGFSRGEAGVPARITLCSSSRPHSLRAIRPLLRCSLLRRCAATPRPVSEDSLRDPARAAHLARVRGFALERRRPRVSAPRQPASRSGT